MTKYFCDMCKKQIIRKIDYNAVSVIQESLFTPAKFDYEFCDDCMKEIRKVIHEAILKHGSITRGEQE